jgi:hypothetical protein
MIRKLILALGATAIIGATALSPTAASAKHWHHHWHGGWYGVGLYPTYVDSDECYYVRKVYFTPSGKHVRRVLVCD